MTDGEAEAFAAALIDRRKFRPAPPAKPFPRLRRLWALVAGRIFPGAPAPNNEAILKQNNGDMK
jgi:hypothetical protein